MPPRACECANSVTFCANMEVVRLLHIKLADGSLPIRLQFTALYFEIIPKLYNVYCKGYFSVFGQEDL